MIPLLYTKLTLFIINIPYCKVQRFERDIKMDSSQSRDKKITPDRWKNGQMSKTISSKAKSKVIEEGHKSRLMIHRASTGVLGCLPVSLQKQYFVIIRFEILRKKGG